MNELAPAAPTAFTNLLVLGDTPREHTGFGRVLQQLLRRWAPHFGRIDIWGIGHMGRPAPVGSEWVEPKYRFFPGGRNWARPEMLQEFLHLLQTPTADGRKSDYSHVFLIQDLFLLKLNHFPQALQEIARLRDLRVLLYFPVDAPIEPDWTDPLAAAEVAVAYTEYGVSCAAPEMKERQAERALELATQGHTRIPAPISQLPTAISHLPHGVDVGVFHRLPDREAIRAELFGGFAGPGDLLLVNVNQHQRRKDLVRSLLLLRELRWADPRYKLVLHCNPVNVAEGRDLTVIAEALGLKLGADWTHTGAQWDLNNYPPMTDAWLNRLYNAADLVVTTTLGEGWGLSLTEAWAAGCPVAAPDHTSCREILSVMASAPGRCVVLPLDEHRPVVLENDNNRVRWPVNVERSARAIQKFFANGRPRAYLTREEEAWLSWDRIAGKWLELMETPNGERGTVGTELAAVETKPEEKAE